MAPPARYPDEVGGTDIYTAVLDHGVRTPEEFGTWLACPIPDSPQRPVHPSGP
ncbi:hypothetical protein AB0J80_30890 [Actinoplanes sp. NPDC049548]|uniref:hypothetical protein n=1 Tax=Actinoplanes sp. NPDC049548 TaxID=3155152 RepID=UPI003440D894